MKEMFTLEQIKTAKSVNLPGFLMANGIKLKKSGRAYAFAEPQNNIKGYEEILIKDNSNEEYGRWYNFCESNGGDNIELLRVLMDLNYDEAMEKLLSYAEMESIKEKTENIMDLFRSVLDKSVSDEKCSELHNAILKVLKGE